LTLLILLLEQEVTLGAQPLAAILDRFLLVDLGVLKDLVCSFTFRLQGIS